jgi:glycosyltransferase involved in cell wall biosynthesis
VEIKDVSIVCPIHGEGRYFQQTLDSIKNQEFAGSLEVVLVLDRCSEEVMAVINSFRSSIDLKVVTSTTPGLVAALNLGLQTANGRYIARIDSDDLMTPERITEQFTYMEANQSVTVLGSSIVEINESGSVIGRREYPIDSRVMHQALSKQCTIAHPSVMFRKDAILRLGGYRSFFENAEDYDLWLRVRDQGIILSTSQRLTLYRIHSDQVSRRNLKKGVFASYSARLNSILERKGLGSLILRYGTFENWGNSRVGKSFSMYLSLRLWISNKIKNFQDGELDHHPVQKLVIGKILLRAKNWKNRS